MRPLFASLAFFFLLSHVSSAQSTVTRNSSYQFSLDLTKVHDDMLTVELTPPLLNKDTLIYKMPAIVPGTYHRYDFGKYIHQFNAFDKSGKNLPVTHTDKNSWEITGAKYLYRITYDVEDTWDAAIVDKDFVFEPAGTNIQADTNFVINNFGFFGYFDRMRMAPYVVSITHKKGFYGSTALSDVKRNENTDTYQVANYIDLADGPIMYNVPDTAHLFIGGADILISVYSPTHKNPAKFIADSLRSLLDAQRQYLGGTLPVKNYAFLFYLTNNPTGYKSHAEGALEHC
ncbi:MAG TPA: peptidase M61, partial [Bacteroidia bacterium]|nr:peptidase M61 [Bacteroidia bacterium]